MYRPLAFRARMGYAEYLLVQRRTRCTVSYWHVAIRTSISMCSARTWCCCSSPNWHCLCYVQIWFVNDTFSEPNATWIGSPFYTHWIIARTYTNANLVMLRQLHRLWVKVKTNQHVYSKVKQYGNIAKKNTSLRKISCSFTTMIKQHFKVATFLDTGSQPTRPLSAPNIGKQPHTAGNGHTWTGKHRKTQASPALQKWAQNDASWPCRQPDTPTDRASCMELTQYRWIMRGRSGKLSAKYVSYNPHGINVGYGR